MNEEKLPEYAEKNLGSGNDMGCDGSISAVKSNSWNFYGMDRTKYVLKNYKKIANVDVYLQKLWACRYATITLYNTTY